MFSARTDQLMIQLVTRSGSGFRVGGFGAQTGQQIRIDFFEHGMSTLWDSGLTKKIISML